jgi:hypothetical protein
METITTDRYTALKECERKIDDACKRTVKDARAIGRELLRIRDDRLFEEAGKESFKQYVEIDLGWEYRNASRLMSISLCAANLESAGLQLPPNESQIAELARLPDSIQASAYSDILTRCEQADVPVTIQIIHSEIEEQEAHLAKLNSTGLKERTKSQTGRSFKSSKPVGITVPDLGNEQTMEAPAVSARRTISLDEDGEAALLRIRRICGDQIADALLYLDVPITQRELERWAEQEDEIVKALAYYIVHERWSLSPALKFHSREPDKETTIEALAHWARSRGGYYAFRYGKALISIQIQNV